jgi:superfamily I DNA/RNA helicase
MELSHYQKRIFNWVGSGEGNGAGIAVAGSGKTFSAVKSMEYIPSHKTIRFNCFGSAIAKELGSRITHLSNAEASTYNALGFRVLKNNWGYVNLSDEGIKGKNTDKTNDCLKSLLGGLLLEEDKKTYYKYKYVIKKLVGLCRGKMCLTTHQAMGMLPELIDHHDMQIRGYDEFLKYFERVYETCINNKRTIDFVDQVFMPIKYGLEFPRVDFLIIDEFQDTNPLQYEIIKRSLCPGGRALVIGDPDQTIYGFSGSHRGIIDQYITEMNAIKLPLYICYRCSKAAVRDAQQWVPHIEPFEKAREGIVDHLQYHKYLEQVTDNDLILCRTIAPLLESVMSFMGRGIPAYIDGKDIKEGLNNLIDRVCDGNTRMDIPRFNSELMEYVKKQKEWLEKLDRENAIYTLESQQDGLQAVMQGCGTVMDLKKRLEIVIPEKGHGRRHMSIHKSKGLETTDTGSVYSLPYKPRKLKKNWMIDEERCLAYVQATRTKNNTFYVTKRSEG